MKKGRRSKLEIMYEILLITSARPDGISKTEIVYKTNSTFTRTQVFLSLLIGNGMLSVSGYPKQRLYSITKKGKVLSSAMNIVLDGMTLRSHEEAIPDNSDDHFSLAQVEIVKEIGSGTQKMK